MQDLPQQLVREAYAQSLASGVRGTHLDAIAAALHISKKTIYKHFPTKSALFKGVFRWCCRQARNQHQAFRRAAAPEELGQLLG